KKTIGNTLRRNGLKYCSTRKVPLLKEAHVQGRLRFANEHLNDYKEDWETGCGQMRPKSSFLASTRLAVFGGGRMLNMTPRTPSPPSSMEVETLGLILEHFLKFLLKCFLLASEKQRKKKTSDKFMNA